MNDFHRGQWHACERLMDQINSFVGPLRRKDFYRILMEYRPVNDTTRPTHPELVAALKKPGADILASLTPEKCDAWHMGSAIPGEAGELFDAVKRWVVYGKDLDRANVVEELGDLEFFMEGLRQNLVITRQETLDHNVAKLSLRYAAGKYSDQQAQDRADKVPNNGSNSASDPVAGQSDRG